MAGNVHEFPMPVKIKHLNGAETTVEFMAKAMRKSEWAALRDAHLNYVKPTGDEDMGDQVHLQRPWAMTCRRLQT